MASCTAISIASTSDIPWPEAKQPEAALDALYRRDPIWHDALYEAFRDGTGAPYARVRLTLGHRSYAHLYSTKGGKTPTLEVPVYARPPS